MATKRKAAKKAAKRKSTRKPKQNVYFFGGGKADGNGSQKNLLGGKGANLAEMGLIGIPVPAGFTITTEVCTYYYDHKKNLSRRYARRHEIEAGIRQHGEDHGLQVRGSRRDSRCWWRFAPVPAIPCRA